MLSPIRYTMTEKSERDAVRRKRGGGEEERESRDENERKKYSRLC